MISRTHFNLMELPDRASGGGYVYVLLFSNNAVKVGSTTAPRSRICTHQSAAAPFGAELTHLWLSPEVKAHAEAEKTLIAEAALLADRVTAREWFHGVDYDLLIKKAIEVVRAAPQTKSTPKHMPPTVSVRVYREWLGLTVDDVVERMHRMGVEVDAETVNDFECGRQQPTPVVRTHWAQAMNTRSDRIYCDPELRERCGMGPAGEPA